jgi:hypothetical protein
VQLKVVHRSALCDGETQCLLPVRAVVLALATFVQADAAAMTPPARYAPSLSPVANKSYDDGQIIYHHHQALSEQQYQAQQDQIYEQR